MAIVLSEDGRRGVLGVLRQFWLPTLTYRLFSNDYVPTILSVPSDFTSPTFDFYLPQLPKNWTGVYTSPEATARTTADPLIWMVGPMGGADTIYGYWVTDSFGYVVFSERNPAGGLPMILPGARYPILPRFDVGTLCP